MANVEISRAVRAAVRPVREQRDMWKRAAVGVFALSLAGNVILYGIACSREARHREETAQLRTELRHVEAVRDDALEELGRMANDYALEAKARREQAEAYEATMLPFLFLFFLLFASIIPPLSNLCRHYLVVYPGSNRTIQRRSNLLY